MMNLLPRHFASTLAGLVLLGMLLMLTACDDDTVAPRVTVPEIDAPQPAEVLLEVPTDEASAASDEITVEYRGLDDVPEIDVSVDGEGSLEVTNRSDSGDSFEGGTTTFALAFSYPNSSVIEPSEATVTISGSSAELNRSASRTVNVDIQKILPEITASSTSLSFEIPEGETASQTRELVISYRALDEVPALTVEDLEGPGSFDIVEGEVEGSPEDGSTTYLITYESDDITEETTADLVFSGANETVDLEESLTVSLTGSGELSGVDGQAGVLTDFLNVADYEERSIDAFGGASADVVQEAPEEASGSRSLSLVGEAGSGVTLGNTVNLGSADRFTFYARGDANRIVDLVWTFRDDAGTEVEFIQSLERNQPWLFFEVPAEEAGLGDLNGTLAEIDVEIERIPDGATAEVFIDDLNFADENGTLFSFFDFFDRTTGNYFADNIIRDYTSDVATASNGVRARQYTIDDGDGDGFFGFNFDLLNLADAQSATLELKVLNTSDPLDLYVFIQTNFRDSGEEFNDGTTVSIPFSDEWTTVEIDLSEIVPDLTALEIGQGGGINNIGFDAVEKVDGHVFVLDDIVIRRGN